MHRRIEMVDYLKYIRVLLGSFSQKIAECCSLLTPLTKELGWNGEYVRASFPAQNGNSMYDLYMSFYHKIAGEIVLPNSIRISTSELYISSQAKQANATIIRV
jgi:hypothetical protein